MRDDLKDRLNLNQRFSKLLSLGIWSDKIAQPDSQVLERIQRLNNDIEDQIFQLYLPDEKREDRIEEIKRQLFEESQQKPKSGQKPLNVTKSSPYNFLGKGVSSKLSNRKTDEEKLASLDLPFITNLEELAELVNTAPRRLLWIAYHDEISSAIHYTDFYINKGKKKRLISKPCDPLSQIQNHIKIEILDKLKFQDYIHGFIKKHNIYDNARPHAKSRSIITIDIKDFFGNINFPMVRSAFHRLGYSGFVSTILALLTTKQTFSKVEIGDETYWRGSETRYLPQGASTSPTISNLVAQKFDNQLRSRADHLDFIYTRYADDLTFSTQKKQANHRAILYLARKTLEIHGFEVNPDKVKILFPHHQQQVTGLNLNSGKPTVPRKWRRRLRAAVHQFRFIKDEDKKEEEYSRIMGSIQHLKLSHPRKAKQYEIEINRYYQIM